MVIFVMVSAAFIVAFVISFILLLFIGGMRLLGAGVIGFGKILLFIRISGFGLIWFPLPLFSSVSRVFHLAVLVCYLELCEYRFSRVFFEFFKTMTFSPILFVFPV